MPPLLYIKGLCSLYLGDLGFVPSSLTHFYVIFAKLHPHGP